MWPFKEDARIGFDREIARRVIWNGLSYARNYGLAGAPRQAVLRRAHSWLHGQTGHRSFLVDRGHLWRTAVRLLTTDQRIVHGQRLHEAGASRTGALGHPEPR